MLMYAAVAVVAVLAAAWLWRRRDTGYSVDEFARARSLTTEWARRAHPEPAHDDDTEQPRRE